jgi:hypothetical protein
MKYAAAYVIVILLARFLYWLGSVVVGFPVSGCLAKAPERVRGVIAGFLSGLGGVAAVVLGGYEVFLLLIGEGAFGLFPLVATVAPLIIPLRKDLATAGSLSESGVRMRELLAAASREVQDDLSHVATSVGLKFRVAGAVLGVALVIIWFSLIK